MIVARADIGSARFFRGALAVLAAGITAGTAVELAMARHWQNLEQGIPWLALVMMTVALGLVLLRPTARRLRVARALAGIVLVMACIGVWRHVAANYDAATLDFQFGPRWPHMSAAARWWAAFIDSVGPAPTLAPLVLAQAAVCVVLATIGHPAFAIHEE
jgi:hypothetical protein